jgi:hypothetical protein
MTIGVIGWGSLIWCPGSLLINTGWRPDGPLLPVEFARISTDGRLTLVIEEKSKPQHTYWAVSQFDELEGARKNLKDRERTALKKIHYLSAEGKAEGIPPEIEKIVKNWLAAQKDVHAAIWTGLESNWKEKRGVGFTFGDAVRYLEELQANKDQAEATFERAREYVTNTPSQIQTSVRELMRHKGWKDASLSSVLFD